MLAFKEMVANKSISSRKIRCFFLVLQCILTVALSAPAPDVKIGKFFIDPISKLICYCYSGEETEKQ